MASNCLEWPIISLFIAIGKNSDIKKPNILVKSEQFFSIAKYASMLFGFFTSIKDRGSQFTNTVISGLKLSSQFSHGNSVQT